MGHETTMDLGAAAGARTGRGGGAGHASGRAARSAGYLVPALALISLSLSGCAPVATLQTDDGFVLNGDYARAVYCGESPVAMPGDAEIIAAWGKDHHVRCSP